MKYIITESQQKKIIFDFLDNKNYLILESNKKIYFLTSPIDFYAVIVYLKENERCSVYYNLVKEVYKKFSLSVSEATNLIGNWVENKVNLNVRSSNWSNELEYDYEVEVELTKIYGIISEYLDSRDFIKFENETSIYLTNSETDLRPQIAYTKNIYWCQISEKLTKEIDKFFNLDKKISNKIIGKWFENRFRVKVLHINKDTNIFF